MMMETFGATVHPSPSDLTEAGRKILAQNPDSPGRSASPSARRSRPPCRTRRCNYALGSVLNHVLLHQTIIGEEALPSSPWWGDAGPAGRLHRRRIELRRPDLPVPAGEARRAAWPRSSRGRARACPSLTKGVYAYDFGTRSG